MKNQKMIVAVMATLLMAMPSAEAGVLSKTFHIAKKAVLFPVYVGGYTVAGAAGGAALGSVIWFYLVK